MPRPWIQKLLSGLSSTPVRRSKSVARRPNVVLRPALAVEGLEPSDQPAIVSIVPSGADLTITTDNVADTYTLLLTADNTIQVSDGGGIEGTFAGVTGALTFNGGTAADAVNST